MGFGDKFAKLSTFTMQKLGKSKPLEEDQEFNNNLTNLSATKKELEALLSNAKHMHERMLKNVKSTQDFSASVNVVETAEAKAATKNLTVLFTKLAESENKLAEEFKINVVLAVENLINVYLNSAYTAKKRYESEKLNYETAQNRFSGIVDKKNAKPEDIDHYKQKTDAAQIVYEESRSQLVEALVSLDVEKSSFFNNNMGRMVSTFQLYGTEVATEASNYNN